MKLIVKELKTHIDQVMTPDQNTIVEAIRPHIYRHNFAAGFLQLQIRDEADALIAESEQVAIADIADADFYHGYVRFYINAYLAKDTPYTVRLISGGGYSFGELAYCGWANGFDLSKYPMNEVPASSMHAPLDLEIWERTVK